MVYQLYLFLSANLIAFATGTVLSRNLREKLILESLVAHNGTADAAKVLEALSSTRADILALERNPASEKLDADELISLLDKYIDVSIVDEDKCDIKSVTELGSLVDFYFVQESTYMLTYLRFYINQQFDLCRRIWESRMLQAVGKLDSEQLIDMGRLLGTMVSFELDPSGERRAKRPFDRKLLAVIPYGNRGRALLSFIKSRAGIFGTASMLSKRCDRKEFEKTFHKFVMGLCERIRQTLDDQIDIYTYAFSKSLDNHLEEKLTNFTMEWLTNARICRRISESPHIAMSETYEALMITSPVRQTCQRLKLAAQNIL